MQAECKNYLHNNIKSNIVFVFLTLYSEQGNNLLSDVLTGPETWMLHTFNVKVYEVEAHFITIWGEIQTYVFHSEDHITQCFRTEKEFTDGHLITWPYN